MKSCTPTDNGKRQPNLVFFSGKLFAPSYNLIEVIGCFTHVIWFFLAIISVQSIYMGTGRTNEWTNNQPTKYISHPNEPTDSIHNRTLSNNSYLFRQPVLIRTVNKTCNIKCFWTEFSVGIIWFCIFCFVLLSLWIVCQTNERNLNLIWNYSNDQIKCDGSF